MEFFDVYLKVVLYLDNRILISYAGNSLMVSFCRFYTTFQAWLLLW